MSAFIREWSDCFKTKSANHVELAQRYVGGLLSQTARKNMERMDERLGHNRKLGTDTYQATQQFISDSPWDVAPIYAPGSSVLGDGIFCVGGGLINSKMEVNL